MHQLRKENKHLNRKLEKHTSATKERRKLKRMIRSLQEDNKKSNSSESSGSSSESEESSDNEETETEIKAEGEARQSPVTAEVSSEEALMTEDLVDLGLECTLEEGDEEVLMAESVRDDCAEVLMAESVRDDCAEHNPEGGSPVVGK